MPLLTPRRRWALTASFLIYVGLLTWAVLWKLELPHVGWGGPHLKLVPFVAGDGYAASAPREVLANVALFVPFGVHLRLLGWRWPGAVFGAALTSMLFEAAQFVLAVGSTDSSDVIANTAGAVVGLALTGVVLRAFGAGLGHRALTRVSVAATAVALVGCGLFFAGPMHYGPQDIQCDQQGVCHEGRPMSR